MNASSEPRRALHRVDGQRLGDWLEPGYRSRDPVGVADYSREVGFTPVNFQIGQLRIRPGSESTPCFISSQMRNQDSPLSVARPLTPSNHSGPEPDRSILDAHLEIQDATRWRSPPRGLWRRDSVFYRVTNAETKTQAEGQGVRRSNAEPIV